MQKNRITLSITPSSSFADAISFKDEWAIETIKQISHKCVRRAINKRAGKGAVIYVSKDIWKRLPDFEDANEQEWAICPPTLHA